MNEFVVTVEQIVWFVSILAAFLTSLAVIFKYISKAKKTVEERAYAAIDKAVADRDKMQDEKTRVLLTSLKESISLDIKCLENSLKAYTDQYTKDKHEEWAVIQLLKESLIEAYKNDIRKIYYKLRDTGEITDYDKAYIDKIFPKYTAIGGNSDIRAKYEEICRVYERRTHEAYDEAYEKNKGKKKKTAKKVVQEEVKEKLEESLAEENSESLE